MGLKATRAGYLIILLMYSVIIFVLLIPTVRDYIFSACVGSIISNYCSRVSGLEASYRLTLVNSTFHFLLMIGTLDCCSQKPDVLDKIHQDGWVFKIPLLMALTFIAFIIPLNNVAILIFYYMCLFGALSFIIIAFVLSLDFAHAWKIFWMQQAHKQSETPTCYLCTWLFLMHLVTSFLYAAALDIIIAFFFFNKISSCLTTIGFLSVNLFLCCVIFALSYYPTLSDLKASSQIIISTITFYTTFVTWLALSDSENEYCNMFGTVFSGSLQDSSITFRSIACVSAVVTPLAFLCFRNENISFTYSLVSDQLTNSLKHCGYARFHLSFFCATSYFLMASTNWYKPSYEYFLRWKNSMFFIMDFDEYCWTRFVGLYVTSSLLPLFYICLLVCSICRTYCKNSRKEKELWAQESADTTMTIKTDDGKDDFIHVHITLEAAVKRLRKIPQIGKYVRPEQSVEYLLIPCFFIRENYINFWHFPRHISQSYYGGRNGSNACTIIAVIIGRLFFRSDICTPPWGYLSETWINIFITSIIEGNKLYDQILKKYGVLDLSVEEVVETFGDKLNVVKVEQSLPVAFESDIETVTIRYQLSSIVNLCKKQVILFIHRYRTGAFLTFPDGSVAFTDSHSYGDEGALLAWTKREFVWNLVDFLKEVLGTNQNKLATLTVIEYEDRTSILSSHPGRMGRKT